MASCAKTFNAVTTRMNETNYPEFVNICKKSATELKKYLDGILRKFYPDTTENEDGFLYAKGTIPILVTAHIDTVHKELVKNFYEHKTNEGKTIISSPQGIGGDDRCGVYMILQILTTTELRPSILFCEDEEVGGIGSDKFCQSKFIEELDSMKFLIELDRANAFDAVFYEDDNKDFHDWIQKETGYKEVWGSFSDICNLSPGCGVASVNFSCGYYNAHTTNEFVVMEEMEHTTEIVKNLLEIANEKKVKQFEYIETVYSNYGYNYSGGWDSIYSGWSIPTKKKDTIIEIYFIDPQTKQNTVWSKEVSSENEGWKEFFFNYTNVCMNDVYDYEYYYI